MTDRTNEPWLESPHAPHGWIQWKGTDVCMDVHCVCGELTHIDADFCYAVKCGSCGALYMVNGNVTLHPVTSLPDGFRAQVTTP